MKTKLTPFDAELLVMITDIMKVEPAVEESATGYTITVPYGDNSEDTIKAMNAAVRGRLGQRLILFQNVEGAKEYTVAYVDDADTMADEIRTELTEPDATAGTRYCRTLKEVDAIQVDRDALDALKRFTGGGTMTIPRTPNGVAVYSFPTENGIMIDAPETSYIVRESNGRFSVMDARTFQREYEPKGIRTVGNYDGQPARPSITEIADLFNELFGTNIASRCRKIEEEFNEYKEVVRAAMPTFDDPAQMNAVIDELADLNAVVFHTAAILGIPQRELLEMAYDKVKGRQTDPNYKRTHPHNNIKK